MINLLVAVSLLLPILGFNFNPWFDNIKKITFAVKPVDMLSALMIYYETPTQRWRKMRARTRNGRKRKRQRNRETKERKLAQPG